MFQAKVNGSILQTHGVHSAEFRARVGRGFLFLGLGMGLLFAVCWNIFSALGTASPKRLAVPRQETSLAQLFTANQFARQITPVDSQVVLKIIKANEIFDRRFSDGRHEYELYVAHWKPGEVEFREAYGHIPDFCWTLAGWRCDGGESRRSIEAGGVTLRPAEWRRFSLDQHVEEVIYWCISNGDLFPYEYNSGIIKETEQAVESNRRKARGNVTYLEFLMKSDFLKFWWDRLQGHTTKPASSEQGGMISHEAYFVRINSSSEFSKLRENRMFQETIAQLAQIGLGLTASVGGNEPRKHAR
jgi:hypothetical protein